MENESSIPVRAERDVQKDASSYLSMVQNYYNERLLFAEYRNPQSLKTDIEISNEKWKKFNLPDVRAYITGRIIRLQITGTIGNQVWNIIFDPATNTDNPFIVTQSATCKVATAKPKQD